mmetsp:Transcript_34541/g.58505  ORF Transcript_34541/g.58505 Transcript_34541/m.58505 type:complete len:1364 (+) Transcript_34541:123-4214(+)|eukprot:jgi/Bigna1/84787/estExt_fgenesh1_pg.C_10060
MDYSSYKPKLGHKMPTMLGHTTWSTVQWAKMVSSGSFKVLWNKFNGIPEWRIDDPDGEKYQLPKLFNNSKGTYIRLCYATVEDIFNRPIASEPNDWIDCIIRKYDPSQQGFNPRLLCTTATKRCLNLSSYNYLGFGGVNKFATPKVSAAIKNHPIIVSSPAGEFGYSKIHKEAEKEIASYLGKEDAVILGMGFATNSTVLPALVGKGDVLISDALNHTSIVQGARETGAKIKVFKHNCVVDLERVLQEITLAKKPFNKILLCVEGIYSMEGDLCKLKEIVAVAKRYGAYIYLDEAHSIGAIGKTGRGVTEELGVDRKQIDIMMGTFTKSFGSTGGYIAGDKNVIDRVRKYSAGCTDAVTIPPACAVQIIEALRVIAGLDGTDIGQKKLRAIRENADYFRTRLEEMGFEVLGERPSPVIPVMLYGPYKIGDFSRMCFNRGLAVVSVGAPAVPLYESRARFCISAAHKKEDLKWALDIISQVGDEIGLKYKGNSRPLPMMPGTLDAEDHTRQQQLNKIRDKVNKNRAAALEKLKVLKYAPLVETVAVVEKKGKPQQQQEQHINTPDEAKVCLGSWDFLDLSDNKSVKAACLETVENKGCGSCGPRGFYGTFPEHMQAEKDIAEFLGMDQAMIYSYGACTTSSVISCMASKDDVIIVDEGCSRNILTGLQLSRARIVYYKHCDIEDCETKIKILIEEDKARFAKQPRSKFLVTEAVFGSTGKLAPVNKLSKLRIKYRCRFILDESFSFGVLGETGRGATEHFGIPASSVDVICGTLEAAGVSCCGFAAGSQGVMGCQRLLGSGYCFSASSPPYLATSVSAAIKIIKKTPEALTTLRSNIKSLKKVMASVPGLYTPSSKETVLCPMFLAVSSGDKEADSMALDRIAARARARGVAVCRQIQNPLGNEYKFLAPALRVCASNAHTNEKIAYAGKVIAEAVEEEFGARIVHSISKSSTLADFPTTPRCSSPDVAGSAATGGKSTSSLKSVVEDAVSGEESPIVKKTKVAVEEEEEWHCHSMPILVIFGLLLNSYRQFLMRQDTITKRLSLGWNSIFPSAVANSTTKNVFFSIATMIGSHSFYAIACPMLVWAFDCPSASLVLVLYCIMSSVGWLIKSMVSTNYGQEYFDGRFRAWPSVSSINAIVLPFFLIRWRYGDMWLYKQFGLWSLGTAGVAIAWALTAVMGRIHLGDSPTNIQGGLFIGAAAIHGWLRAAGPTMDWFQGKTYSLMCPPFAIMAILLLLTPLPTLNGRFVSLARIYYVRAANMLVLMTTFMLGSALVPPLKEAEFDTVTMLIRSFVGLALYISFSTIASIMTRAVLTQLVAFTVELCPCLRQNADSMYQTSHELATNACKGLIVSAGVPIILRSCV